MFDLFDVLCWVASDLGLANQYCGYNSTLISKLYLS